MHTTDPLLPRLYQLARPYGVGKLTAVAGLSLLQALVQTVGITSIMPFLSVATDPGAFRSSDLGQRLLSSVTPLSDTQLLIGLGMLSISLLLLSAALTLAAEVARGYYVQGLTHNLRIRLADHLARLPYAHFVGTDTGVLQKKLVSDTQVVAVQVMASVLDVMMTLAQLTLLVTALLLIDPVLSLSAFLGIGLLYSLAFLVFSRYRLRAREIIRQTSREVHSESLNFLSGIKTLLAYGAVPDFIQRVGSASYRQALTQRQLTGVQLLPRQIVEPAIFGIIIGYVLYIIMSGQSLTGVLPIMSVLALAGYKSVPAVQRLYAAITRIATSKHAVDELLDEFHEPATAPLPADSVAPLHFKQLQLSDVSFTYEARTEPAIDRINLVVERGDAIAITGVSGSGKTTLIDVLLGLYEPTTGAFTVNGQALSESMLPAYRGATAYVEQHGFIVNDSVLRNVTLGVRERDIDEARVWSSCEAAQIADFVRDELPQGLHTRLGNRGVRLSGGQAQRIALARALYRQPQLLILDEATSALDDHTQARVSRAIDAMLGNITLIVIAHRKSTLQNIPTHYEMHDGRLVKLESAERHVDTRIGP